MAPRIERFEDLIAWQKARALHKKICGLCESLQRAGEYGMKHQIRRSAISVMANISEGFERARPAEFHQFLSIAKGSCGEVRSHLYAVFDAGYLSENDFDELQELSHEVTKIIGGLRASVQRKRDRF